jgi:periplasmic divalent cation tolerance protein
MSDLVLIYSLFPSAGEAHDCCRTLVTEKLVASANRLTPAISYYAWNGEIDTSEEHPVLFKTSAACADAAIARIGELHRYQVPAILSWQADKANPLFADWVVKQAQQ